LKGNRTGQNAVKSGSARRSIAVAILVWLVCLLTAFGQQRPAPVIRGTVHDAAGTPVSGASVRLEHNGAPPAETTTSPDGTFSFPAIQPGSYTVTAEKSGHHSHPLTVNAAQPEGEHLLLTIKDSDSTKNSSAPPAQSGGMEFADTPSFTIAAVTDWTAAGGHGSDAVLRTSESLNRETLNLTPGGRESPPARQTAKWKEQESALRAAVANAPNNLEAHYALGKFYLETGQFDDALAPLESVYKIDPNDYDNELDLALALKSKGDLAQAREHVQKLLASHETAEVHRLAGELDEKIGDPLSAVREFERAVRHDPSEQNYFEWGSELLLHRAVWQAKDVFSAGVTAYPKSSRMLTALGAALFAGALYDEAAQRLCEASDLNPADSEPYTFMGKIEISAPNPLPCVEQKLARFAEQRPADPLANYFYAMTLWKQKGQSTDPAALARVEGLLSKAVTVDRKCSDAYFQLGVLQATQRDFAKAIDFYTKAIEVNPQLSEAHYRLGVAYDRIGEKDKAAQQFRLHDEIEKQQAAAVEKQRREVKQFLVVMDDRKSDSTPR
jgi:tetratricopeptide (TPR) repeat protein